MKEMKKSKNNKKSQKKKSQLMKVMTGIFGGEMSTKLEDRTLKVANQILLDKIPKEKLQEYHEIGQKADDLMLSGKITPRQSVQMQFDEMKKADIIKDEKDFIEIWRLLLPEIKTMEDIVAQEMDNLLRVNQLKFVGDMKEHLEKQLSSEDKK